LAINLLMLSQKGVFLRRGCGQTFAWSAMSQFGKLLPAPEMEVAYGSWYYTPSKATLGGVIRGSALTEQRPPKVFISYSHDTVAHQKRVLDLADRLRADGIDAEIDQYNDSPPEGWPRWCERQIEAADFVLMVCTETYHRRVRGEEERGKGLGVVWEAAIIRQLLYDAGAVSSKFVPVLFADGSPEHIPTPIKGWSHYVVDGYESLYRRLTGQPHLPRPALGAIRTLPIRRHQWPVSVLDNAGVLSVWNDEHSFLRDINKFDEAVLMQDDRIRENYHLLILTNRQLTKLLKYGFC
jgi:SEFIR domain-containing protein